VFFTNNRSEVFDSATILGNNTVQWQAARKTDKVKKAKMQQGFFKYTAHKKNYPFK